MEDVTTQELEEIIREILNSGRISYTNHVKQQMPKRGYQIGDIKHIIQNGKIVNFTSSANEYKCEIHGEDIEGDNGGVIVVIIKKINLLVITVLGGT